MATAARTPAVSPNEGLAERVPRRRRAEPLGADSAKDRSPWTVAAGGTVTDVSSRAAAWSAATDAYASGRPVVVRSTE